jgi:hypothetical protein
MTLPDLYDLVSAERLLEGLDVSDDQVVIRHIPSNSQVVIPISEVLSHEPADLLRVLLYPGSEQPLRHVSRICGYFSRLEAWNSGKIGEWRDRQKGNYTV